MVVVIGQHKPVTGIHSDGVQYSLPFSSKEKKKQVVCAGLSLLELSLYSQCNIGVGGRIVTQFLPMNFKRQSSWRRSGESCSE